MQFVVHAALAAKPIRAYRSIQLAVCLAFIADASSESRASAGVRFAEAGPMVLPTGRRIAVLLLLLALAARCGGTSVSQVAAPGSGKCQPVLSGVPASVPASGASVTATVSTTRDCTWSTSTSDAWLRVDPASGQGGASVTVVAAQNTTTNARTATLSINGVSVTVSQAAAPPPPAPSPTPTPAPTPAPNPGPGSSVSFSGRVANVSGKCPSLSFTVDGRQVVTDAATVFAGGPCKDVRDGATVTVSGQQRGSAVYATRITLNKG